MIEQHAENGVSHESGSEYQIACRAQALDELLESALHLFFYVTKGGVIHTMTGLSKELKLLQDGNSYAEKNLPLPQVFQGLSLDAMMPWLWDDFKAFVQGGAEHADVEKRVNVAGRSTEYHVRFSKILSADGGTAGVVISIMAQSEIGRADSERRRLLLFEENFRQVRTFCHDFSQPLMVLMGYWELINSAPPGEKKQLIKIQIEGLQHELDRLSGSFQKLRSAILHCRQQIDLIGPPPDLK
jgi:hypothetical protein